MQQNIQFTQNQKEILNKVGKILEEFNQLKDISLTLTIKNNSVKYCIFRQVNNEDKLLVEGDGEHLLDAAQKAKETINQLLQLNK